MSDTDQQIVFCDVNDNTIGVGSKITSHNTDTKLHKAFSCYVFNERNEFLLTQRAKSKKVWPGVWTNSLCGHPMPSEAREAAIVRRAQDELGILLSDIQCIVRNFIYRTPEFKKVIEHEYCPIYLAKYIGDNAITVNPNEVEEYKWLPKEEFIKLQNREDLSYWSKLQIPLVIEHLKL